MNKISKITKFIFLRLILLLILNSILLEFNLSKKVDILQVLYASENDSYNSNAMGHFIEGIMYDMRKDYALAILEYQDAMKNAPNVPIFYYLMGDDYYYLRKDDNAIEMYEKYLELQPDDYETARFLLFRLYLLRREFQKAEKLVENMINNLGEITSLKLLLTDLYLKNNKIERAILNSSYYLGNPSIDADIYKNIANSFIKMGYIDIGVSLFEGFLSKFANNDKLYYGLGSLYLAKKDTTKVIELLEKGLKLKKGAGYIEEDLCDVYLGKKNFKKAKALFDNVSLESKMKIADAYYVEGKDKEAEVLLNKLKNENKNVWFIHFRLGEIKYNESKHKEAVDNFLKVIEIDSTISEPYFRVSLSYFKLKNYPQALVYIDKSIKINPKELRFFNLKADIVYNMGDFHGAEKIYYEIFKIDPEYDLALNNYSYILAERGEKLNEALEMSNKAVKKRPRNGSYLDTLGWIYYKLNRFEESLKYLKEAVDINEEEEGPHPVVLEHLGDIYLKLGDIKNAHYFWKRALELDKNNKNLSKKIEENKK